MNEFRVVSAAAVLIENSGFPRFYPRAANPGMIFYAKQVDYHDSTDANELLRLFREYASFENCDRPELSGAVAKLAEMPTAFSVLAFDHSHADRAIGLVNCFFGFSTFELRPLVNVHDLIVTSDYRGKGVAALMLEEVERIARAHDCCRLTLEVYADNTPARRAYEKHGFMRDPAHPDVDVHFLRKGLS